MQAAELQTLLACGEDSRHQFKRDLHFVQSDQSFNSLGLLEVPEEAFVGLFPEQIRTGISYRRTKGLAEQVTPEVTPEVMKMLKVLNGEMRQGEIMAALGLKDEKLFREHYQQAGMATDLIEMTIPDKPNSSKQRYWLTELGRAQLDKSINGER